MLVLASLSQEIYGNTLESTQSPSQLDGNTLECTQSPLLSACSRLDGNTLESTQSPWLSVFKQTWHSKGSNPRTALKQKGRKALRPPVETLSNYKNYVEQYGMQTQRLLNCKQFFKFVMSLTWKVFEIRYVVFCLILFHLVAMMTILV